MAVVHVVKSWPRFFQPIIAGVRHHELRVNDRDYQVDDIMLLQEFDEKTNEYTEREYYVRITSITSKEVPCAASGVALADDHCILSIEPV